MKSNNFTLLILCSYFQSCLRSKYSYFSFDRIISAYLKMEGSNLNKVIVHAIILIAIWMVSTKSQKPLIEIFSFKSTEVTIWTNFWRILTFKSWDHLQERLSRNGKTIPNIFIEYKVLPWRQYSGFHYLLSSIFKIQVYKYSPTQDGCSANQKRRQDRIYL